MYNIDVQHMQTDSKGYPWCTVFTMQLEQRLADVDSSCAALRTRLRELWSQLDTGPDERASTTARTAGTSERVRDLVSAHLLL